MLAANAMPLSPCEHRAIWIAEGFGCPGSASLWLGVRNPTGLFHAARPSLIAVDPLHPRNKSAARSVLMIVHNPALSFNRRAVIYLPQGYIAAV